MDLMAVKQDNGEIPLYMHTGKRILREMRITQQGTKGSFDYQTFKDRVMYSGLNRGQLGPLKQRLETLESFTPEGQVHLWRRQPAVQGSTWKAVVRETLANSNFLAEASGPDT
ncbi:hypothetical protein BDV41DRAFT_307779 [Aspergillus transmontanensis]|uniref:Uncharacterized protein n=1 Tax=Aspergillus transmontanensis TaxID=1034304 RepID=A0A5N6VWN7_9EURO|nr:hypothetical protein BDV41DRAFT_307779 [Aspergillus transmontanensis]